MVKNLPANARASRDVGSIPGWGRSPEEGNGSPLQNSCLEVLKDRGAWRATVHEVAKSRTLTEAIQHAESLRQPGPCPPGKGEECLERRPRTWYRRQAAEAVGRRWWAPGEEGSPSEEPGVETRGTKVHQLTSQVPFSVKRGRVEERPPYWLGTNDSDTLAAVTRRLLARARSWQARTLGTP